MNVAREKYIDWCMYYAGWYARLTPMPAYPDEAALLKS